ncbi:MAG: DUF2071 domain-containing protein [Verrucomicrobiae bacterium]|nr:DUF2071 domain-containing protein [Verrucomicrobiae bacterium]
MKRRILVNFRIRPEVLAPRVPRPFRLKTVRGWGLAGICLIRLEHLRPGPLPAWAGLSSENAAHRIAVSWDSEDGERDGVFILGRDTNSGVNRWAGGRLFPGVHRFANFHTFETGGRMEVTVCDGDGVVVSRVVAEATEDWPAESVFGSLAEASEFFRDGCTGWSRALDGRGIEGAQLEPDWWAMTALKAIAAESRVFQDPERFPAGTVELDSALGMYGIPHTWRNLGLWPAPAPERASGSGACPRGTHGPGALFRFP